MEIEITGITPGGMGYGESPEGRIYVRKTVPGDRVEIDEERGSRLADPIRVVGSERPRREAPCSHFGQCGGCDWMHLPYEEQLKLKQEMVTAAFKGQALHVSIQDIAGSPEEFRYRNRMDFAFGNAEDGPVIGLYEKSDSEDQSHQTPPVCEVRDCWLASEDVNKIRGAVQVALKGSRLRAYNPVTRTGVLRSLEIRTGVDGSAVSLSVANDKHVPEDKIVSGLEACGAPVAGISIRVGRSRSKHAPPKKISTLLGQDRQSVSVLGNTISFSGGVFSQVNAFHMERLYQIAMEMAETRTEDRVLDLYCGVGTLSVAIAERAEHVTGVELEIGAIEDARQNAIANGRSNCDFVCADAANVKRWGKQIQQFNLVTVNPPRAGLATEVVEAVAATRADRVFYVSCNSETLARDCKRLCAHNYVISEVRPVDMFPQTTHVEAVVKLERRGRG